MKYIIIVSIGLMSAWLVGESGMYLIHTAIYENKIQNLFNLLINNLLRYRKVLLLECRVFGHFPGSVQSSALN